jgi:hypothetical protein
MRKNLHDRPLAAKGLISYRAKGRYGYIMIGAKDDSDAWNEAKRSTDSPTELEVWNGERYISVEHNYMGAFDVNKNKKKETMPRKKITPIVKMEDPKQLGKIGVIQEILKLVEAHNGVVNAILNDYLVTDGAELEIGAAGNNLWKDIEQLLFTDNPEEDFDTLFKKLKDIEDDLGINHLKKLSTLFTNSEEREFMEELASEKKFALIKVDNIEQQEKLRAFAETEIWPHFNQQRVNILI